MGKVTVIGSGPAGISAAIYAKRAGMDTTVISMGQGALNKAHMIENYYGLEKPLSGSELHETGIRQAKALGIEVINGQVHGIGFENSLTVITSDGTLETDALILATGSARNVPKIPGVVEFEGKGVSYCAVCDGFFHRGKNVVVLGSGEYAVHEALDLLPIAGSVTILTDGKEPDVEIPEGILVNTLPIKEVTGDQLLSSVIFEDGSSMEISGFFVALGSAGSVELARKLGVITEGNSIVVDELMATNVPGLFAAGDCTGGMLQVAKAVYQGAVAGNSAVKFLRKK